MLRTLVRRTRKAYVTYVILDRIGLVARSDRIFDADSFMRALVVAQRDEAEIEVAEIEVSESC